MKLIPTLPILGIMILVQTLAVLLALPAKLSAYYPSAVDAIPTQALGNAESPWTPLIYIGLIVLVSAAMIIAIRYRLGRFGLRFLFVILTWDCMFLILAMILPNTTWGLFVVGAVPVFCAFLIWRFPEWYVIDAIGIYVCAAAVVFLGSSFGIIPIIILLLGMALYDYLAVYRTKHMITIAEFALNNNLPVLFVFPYKLSYSYIKDKFWQKMDSEKHPEASILGFGDIVFPSMLVVSANTFIRSSTLVSYPAIGAAVGSLIGVVLMEKYCEIDPRGHAGLPWLNSFALIGFAIGLGISASWGLL